MSFIESSDCAALYGDLVEPAKLAAAKKSEMNQELEAEEKAATDEVYRVRRALVGKTGYERTVLERQLEGAQLEEARVKDKRQKRRLVPSIEEEDFKRLSNEVVLRNNRRLIAASKEIWEHWVAIEGICEVAQEELYYCRGILADLNRANPYWAGGRVSATEMLPMPYFLRRKPYTVPFNMTLAAFVDSIQDYVRADKAPKKKSATEKLGNTVTEAVEKVKKGSKRLKTVTFKDKGKPFDE